MPLRREPVVPPFKRHSPSPPLTLKPMTQTYLPDGLVPLLARAIDEGVEGPKIDFKREITTKGDALGELLIDLCSIANTDDPEHYDDAGYLIIGFERDGTHHSLPTDFDPDKLSANLHNTLSKHVSPPVNFTVAGPFQHPKGEFAVIRIPPSLDQPHLVIRESGVAKTGMWWVRRGDTKELAGPQDYVRVLRKAVARETAPLRERVTSTQALLENLEARLERLQASAIERSGGSVADAPDLDVAAKIRARYGTEDTALRQALHRELLQFLGAFEALFPDREVEQVARDPERWRMLVEQLEQITRPLGEALGAAILHAEGELDDAVAASLGVVAERTLTFPSYGSLTDSIRYLRTYPHALLLFAVYAASLGARRTAWLRDLASTPITAFHDKSHILDWTRSLVQINERFGQAFGLRSCAPAYQRMQDVVTEPGGWLTGGDPFTDTTELGLEVELLQSLSLLDTAESWALSTPIPNTLVYHRGADDMIASFLTRDAELLQQALTRDLGEQMKRYVDEVSNYSVHRSSCYRQVTAEALAPLQK